MNRIYCLVMASLLSVSTSATAYSTSVEASASAANGVDSELNVDAHVDLPAVASALATYEGYAASAFASANAGVLKAYAAASVESGTSTSAAFAKSIFSDTIRLNGASNLRFVQVLLNFRVEGGISGPGGASGFVELGGSQGKIDFAQSYYSAPAFTCGTWSGDTGACDGTAIFALRTNTDISISGLLSVAAGADGYLGLFDPFRKRSQVDFSHTARTFISVLDPNYQLTSQSGYSYAPVPLPPALALFAVGLAAIAPKRRLASISRSV
ncbi:hypothetical protein PL263_18720 [Methylomonas sp. EFPC3]|uniref:hypothetical protein n=1 Tax=Methylomonas sp. EFPC3 TaxID=3021710 RepID=UPI0024171871|nr:hypothetical protein [Methylomonas sp. EFPC3]WFP50113.1 hypothetical protein PL263_18720 [Methylomonas sp. EFPC3]